MKTILALAISGAALFAVASPASAQECVGGYMMLKDQIPIRCDAGLGAEQVGIAPVQPAQEEPLYTGSINSAGAGNGNADEIPTAANRVDDSCWMETANSGVTLPRPCN